MKEYYFLGNTKLPLTCIIDFSINLPTVEHPYLNRVSKLLPPFFEAHIFVTIKTLFMFT